MKGMVMVSYCTILSYDNVKYPKKMFVTCSKSVYIVRMVHCVRFVGAS